MIYCILGMSGTRKTTIARRVAKELKIPLVISYTSRPIRSGETQDVDYHYVDNKHFDENKDDFIEMREYEVYDGSIWKYGYKKSSFNDKNKDYLVVIETEGYKAFKNYFGKDKIKPILINSQIGDLYLRLQKRGDNPKEIELQKLGLCVLGEQQQIEFKNRLTRVSVEETFVAGKKL